MNKEYKGIAFRAQLSGKLLPHTIARQFEDVLNLAHKEGWSYNSVDNINVEIASGCLGSLFGSSYAYTRHDVITFERSKIDPVASSHIRRSNRELRDRPQKTITPKETPKYIFSSDQATKEITSTVKSKSRDEPKDIVAPVSTARPNLWYKNKANLKYFIGAVMALAATFYMTSREPSTTYSTNPEIENVVKAAQKAASKSELKTLISDFKIAYKEGSYQKADVILIRIEELSPGSNFATSARRALDKRLNQSSN